jgi:hypothetical protein
VDGSVLKVMKTVYICSPLSAGTPAGVGQNIRRAKQYSRYAMTHGCVPYAPHLIFPQFCSEAEDREAVLEMCCQMVMRCDEVWVFGRETSAGMAREIETAHRFNKPVRRFINGGKGVSDAGQIRTADRLQEH